MSAAHTLAGAMLGAGLGVQVLLSFVVAPAAFRLLDRPLAVQLMEAVFPAYYGVGLVTTGVALALVLALAARHRGPLRWGAATLLALTLGGTLYADASETEMYAAVDSLFDKLDRQITKRKEKLTDHHARDAAKSRRR